MTRRSFGARDLRAVVLGLAVALPALGYRFAVQPYLRALDEARSAVAAQRDLLERERAVVAAAPAYPAATQDALRALEAERSRLFSGADDLTASAAVVNHVGRLARNRRVLVQQSETRPAFSAGPGVTTLPVAIRGISDLHGLLEFLHALETGDRLIRVDEVRVERSAAVAVNPRADEEVLTFTALVSAFALRDGGGTEPRSRGGGE